jgi:site-specific DNA-methyltransferase (adenine-specific)
MSRVEHIGRATLYLGDCRDILPTLQSVDTLIADPPYAIRNNFGSQAKLDGTRTLQFAWDGAATRDETIEAIAAAGALANAFFVFCGASQVSFFELVLEQRFTVKPACWVKACPPPAMPGNWWPSGFEFALYGYTPGAPFNDADPKRRNVFYSDTYRAGIRAYEKVDHPTQKWLPLMRGIVVALVPAAGSCLDPFMGSGSTGVACMLEARNFIGIERDPTYFDIACRRIEDAQRQGSLFGERAA